MKKNLLFYCFIQDIDQIDDATHLSLSCLKQYGICFNGQKIIFVGSNNPDGMDKGKLNSLFEFFCDAEIHIVRNNQDTRESEHFVDMLSSIEDLDSMTFYAHNKGSTHALDEGLFHWIHMMYFFNLYKDVIPSIEHVLSMKTMSGVFRKNSHYEIHGMSSEWHYSGAFFWFNMNKLTKISEWKNARKHRMGLEFYPSSIISRIDSHCSFGEKNHNFDMTLPVFMDMLEQNEHKSSYIDQIHSIWKK
jgi:hypothetical protein